jgi:uncharacterized protein YfaS (alpha-2-macroglobulin family)
MRRKLAGAVCATAVLGAVAGAAVANTTTGNQNPQLRVTAALTPNAAKVGSRFHAVLTVTNTTSKIRQVAISYEFDGPSSGMGTAMSPIPIKPHSSWTHTFSPKASSAGKYSLSIQAKDARGTSKTTATASAS